MEMTAFSVLLSCRKQVFSIFHSPFADDQTGASSRCSWPETNTKKQTSSFVLFRAATTYGANSASEQLKSVGRSIRAMAHRN